MPTHKVDILLKGYCSHTNIIKQLSKLFGLEEGDKVELRIEIDPSSSFLYPDYLLLISAALNSTKQRGIEIEGESFYCKPLCEDYVSRMNFFDSLGINFAEQFIRRDPAGRFLEISSFDNFEEGNNLINRVILILKSKELIEDSLFATISLCLGELVGNVVEHSVQDGETPIGWVVAQHYPAKNKIRIMVVDNGRGIHDSLTKSPKSEFKEYSPQIAVERCIVKGVTNGKGLGNGLYATANFIEQNGGEFFIHSGNWVLTIKDKSKRVNAASNWQGTIVFLELAADVPVAAETILDGYTDYVDDFNDWFQ